MSQKIGAHVSIAGGYTMGLERITEMGGNCMQIFSSSPRDWKHPSISDEQILEFQNRKKELSINPVFFHAWYLINLANDGFIGQSSVHTLTHELYLASMLGVQGSIIHLGSFANGTYGTLIENSKKILTQTPQNAWFIIENAGTKKIGTDIDEIARIMDDLSDDRVKVCLDTCHLHAAGYDLSSEETLEDFLITIESKIGLSKIALFHLNDSKDGFSSNRDRHENIGEGNIPPSVFSLLLNHPKTKDIPFIIETPGFDKKGPDKKNLDIVKGFINK
jgi:deoxyribonuclease-4